ncbi:MAG: MTH1187 family thiamine-binding protein [Dehalococcoidia bacterium]|nr:MTH1187 family thiamine-binding protein [Dehalococcoidia bacterium]
MAVAEITVVPSGVGPSVSDYVARAIRVISSHADVRYQLTPMGTVVEGELDSILDVVRDVHNCAFDGHVCRVLTLVKIDERRDKELTMEGKLRAVHSKLPEPADEVTDVLRNM